MFHERCLVQEPISVHRVVLVFFSPHPDIYLIKSFARCGEEKTLAIDLVEGENRSSIAEKSNPSLSSFSRLLASCDDNVENSSNSVLSGSLPNAQFSNRLVQHVVEEQQQQHRALLAHERRRKK